MQRNILGKRKRRILVRNRKRDEMEKIKNIELCKEGVRLKNYKKELKIE